MAGLLGNMVLVCQLHLLLFLLLFSSVTEEADGAECWPFPSGSRAWICLTCSLWKINVTLRRKWNQSFGATAIGKALEEVIYR